MRNYTHSPTFFSEDDKHIAVNRLSVGEAGLLSKEHTKKKKKKRKKKKRKIKCGQTFSDDHLYKTTTCLRQPMLIASKLIPIKSLL